MRACYSCGQTLGEDMKVFRGTGCSSCGRDLRVCRNCEFYCPGSHWDCHETIDEQVIDKEKANFCSYFRFRPSEKSDKEDSPRQEARSDFDRLFGGDG